MAGEMRPPNIAQALALVDRMVGLSVGERQRLSRLIPKAARGDWAALAEVILFPYDLRHRDIFSEIIFLTLKGS